jgi:hypothetical protein
MGRRIGGACVYVRIVLAAAGEQIGERHGIVSGDL